MTGPAGGVFGVVPLVVTLPRTTERELGAESGGAVTASAVGPGIRLEGITATTR